MKKVTNNSKLNPANTIGSFLAAGLLIFGAVSCGQERGTQDEGLATEQEYEEGYGVDATADTEPVTNTATEDFDRYDRNTDQQWDRDEFNTSMGESTIFNDWDTDRDGFLNENEYNEGTRNWQGENRGVFGDWDADRNGNIDQNEFNEGTFNAWDADRNGTLNSDEYNRGMGMNNTGITGDDNR